MATKHTQEYALKVTKRVYIGTIATKEEKDAFYYGYMEAIKETNVAELLEALIDAQKSISSYDNNFRDGDVLNKINNAIKKATE